MIDTERKEKKISHRCHGYNIPSQEDMCSGKQRKKRSKQTTVVWLSIGLKKQNRHRKQYLAEKTVWETPEETSSLDRDIKKRRKRKKEEEKKLEAIYENNSVLSRPECKLRL
ncbi:uncharacterized protein ARB_05095 [Trichophyton benhamiae CBS 112371]|uniref:Uncharacterized protein n=1 Tax=Arthroderma benhamiae (strain ATCC MYA-4681 / CBS 112371) TaxID=663331 RepID=D4AL98_ARTBC|nr:uncharacterized protein ARB_05095 [Trichophyton benhamiae CBS 112371]EFE36157.1 hypothetical protein ARB_05095 [Trichophyton benhamiae CBS 112371]